MKPSHRTLVPLLSGVIIAVNVKIILSIFLFGTLSPYPTVSCLLGHTSLRCTVLRAFPFPCHTRCVSTPLPISIARSAAEFIFLRHTNTHPLPWKVPLIKCCCCLAAGIANCTLSAHHQHFATHRYQIKSLTHCDSFRMHAHTYTNSINTRKATSPTPILP